MNELKGQATAEQIAEWKAKYNDLYAISVDGHICYLHKPDRKTISYASSIGPNDPIKFNEILLKNCWCGGSDDIPKNDDLFMSVSGKLIELLEVKEAELVKL